MRFVPLIGAQGWAEQPGRVRARRAARRAVRERRGDAACARRPSRSTTSSATSLDALLERIGDARVVLLGEATHGTSRVLPDARAHHARAHRAARLHVRRGRGRLARRRARRRLRAPSSTAPLGAGVTPFTRFPTWMWRNREVDEFVDWLRALQRRASTRPSAASASTASTSTACSRRSRAVLALPRRRRSRRRARRARPLRLPDAVAERSRPPTAAPSLVGRLPRAARPQVVAMLRDLLDQRLDVLSAATASASSTPRRTRASSPTPSATTAPCTTARASRGTCATSTCSRRCRSLLAFRGPDAKAVVWEHNSHVGNAARDRDGRARRAQRRPAVPRRRSATRAYLVGFGTDHGTVAAATDWDEPME